MSNTKIKFGKTEYDALTTPWVLMDSDRDFVNYSHKDEVFKKRAMKKKPIIAYTPYGGPQLMLITEWSDDDLIIDYKFVKPKDNYDNEEVVINEEVVGC